MTILDRLSRLVVLTPKPFSRWKVAIGLALLTLAALAAHGYHPYAEDAEIYLPGVEKILNPGLFPTGTEFFESHASLTLFPHLIAGFVRVSHLPFDYALFAWHAGSIFLLLLAVWELAGICFDSVTARWGAACLMAALLTLPVAGTALYVMDQYLNPRNLAAFTALFAVTKTLQRHYVAALLWLLFGAACHPLMSAFAFTFCALLVILERYVDGYELKSANFAMLFPLAQLFASSSPAYHESARLHTYFYIVDWAWYEWLGIMAPLLIFWWMARNAQGRGLRNLARVCRTLIVYDLVYFAAALIVTIPRQFEAFARVQPLRSLHLLYMLLIVFGGAYIADYILKDRLWRWILLFLPMSLGMFFAQRALFPGSPHLEWPWAAPQNQWEQAFLWIRHSTPSSAIFAIDPMYIKIPGEDTVGFRAVAERSRLADVYKDGGAVSMFPPLAEEWWEQYSAQKNWRSFTSHDFARLREKYGVSWVVLQAPESRGLNCPYANSAVLVCHAAQ